MTSALHGSQPPSPRGPWDTLEGHRQGRLCPSLLGVGEGLSPTAHVEQEGASGQFSQPHAPPALAHCLPWVIAVALGLGACVYSPPTAARRTLWRHHEITSQLLKATLPLPQVRPTSPCLVLSHFRGVWMFVTLSLPLCPSLCDPMDCSLPGSSVSGILLTKDTGVGCRARFQEIFPTQGLKLRLLWLLHWQVVLYH